MPRSEIRHDVRGSSSCVASTSRKGQSAPLPLSLSQKRPDPVIGAREPAPGDEEVQRGYLTDLCRTMKATLENDQLNARMVMAGERCVRYTLHRKWNSFIVNAYRNKLVGRITLAALLDDEN
jgi:hypothetical protein